MNVKNLALKYSNIEAINNTRSLNFRLNDIINWASFVPVNPNVIKKEILLTEDCSFCTYLDRRIVRRLAFLQLKRKKWRKTRVNWCCLTVEGALNLAARIAFRSGYENFPTRPPGFFRGHRFYFQPWRRTLRQTLNRRSTFWKRERHVLGEQLDDRMTIDWMSKTVEHMLYYAVFWRNTKSISRIHVVADTHRRESCDIRTYNDKKKKHDNR